MPEQEKNQTEVIKMPEDEDELRGMLGRARLEGAKDGASTIINEAAQRLTLAENYAYMDSKENPLPHDFVREGFDAAAEASRRLGQWNEALRENRVSLVDNPLTKKSMLKINPRQETTPAPPPIQLPKP